MDAAVQAFKDKMAEKAAAKQITLAAVGEARLAEYEGRADDAGRHWATVAEYGISDGIEGAAAAELQAMANAYVDSHPEHFIAFEEYKTPDGLESIVKVIDAFRDSGMEEAALRLTMFELASFNRQAIGVETRPTVRIGNGV